MDESGESPLDAAKVAMRSRQGSTTPGGGCCAGVGAGAAVVLAPIGQGLDGAANIDAQSQDCSSSGVGRPKGAGVGADVLANDDCA